MSRTNPKKLIEASSGAVGAFNVILLEHAEAYVAAAEKTNTGLVLQISENCVKYHGALAPIAKASLSLVLLRSSIVSLITFTGLVSS